MDFDGDGIPDLVSGSYDPGELYLFRGLGKGRFASRAVIKDRSGKPILKVPDQKEKVESFGSWMALVDWDDDGDLDILVGTFEGTLFLRRNEGTRTRPLYATANEWVKVGGPGGKKMRVPGGEHFNPVIADWDGDGRWDIVTGSGEGGVYWYRNVGQKGEPRFEPPVALVARHEGLGYGEMLAPGQQPRPGIRTQIAVADYDGDGKLDLLAGDFCTNLHPRPDLTDDERKQLQSVIERCDAAVTKLRAAMEDVRERYKKSMAGVPKSDWNTKENQEKWQKMYKAMQEAPEYKKLREEYERLEKEQQRFVDKDARRGTPDRPHGYVWLVRRK